MASLEEHTVTYDDNGTSKSLFYLAAGPASGPLIVFLHGWPGIAKTWLPQLTSFSSLGFRAIAPDMPGYGRSTARPTPHSDYAQPSVVAALLALLAHASRPSALWVAHDWGASALWTLANTHPHVCRAIAALCVPYWLGGIEPLLDSVDRDLYPVDRYPYGQWSYIFFYQQSFDKAARFFDAGPRAVLKMMLRRADPASYGKPAITADVVRDGGWMGGAERPPPAHLVPDGEGVLDDDVFEELVAAMERNGFEPANAWYVNNEANLEYNTTNAALPHARIDVPVLFVHARYDQFCHTVTGRLAEPMRHKCSNLTETVVDAGHWVGAEKPREVNAAIVTWILEEAVDCWPGHWVGGWTKRNMSSLR